MNATELRTRITALAEECNNSTDSEVRAVGSILYTVIGAMWGGIILPLLAITARFSFEAMQKAKPESQS